MPPIVRMRHVYRGNLNLHSSPAATEEQGRSALFAPSPGEPTELDADASGLVTHDQSLVGGGWRLRELYYL